MKAMDIITSKDNATVKNVKKLLEKASERRKQDVFVAEGVKMCDEAVSMGRVKTLLVSESFYDKCSGEFLYGGSESALIAEKGTHITELIRNGSKNVVRLSDGVMRLLSDTVNPQGVMALVHMPHSDVTERPFLENAFKRDGYIKLLVLDDVADPGNLGTMMRTAEAAGMTGVIMSRGCVDIFNPKTVRSTMGSILRVPFTYVEKLSDTVQMLKDSGIMFYVTHLRGEKYFNEMEYDKKCAVVIGNEARGVSSEISEICDNWVKIPMHGSVESLNAAIAAALMMYAL